MDYLQYKTVAEIRTLLLTLHKLIKNDVKKRLYASGTHMTNLQYTVMKALVNFPVTLSILAQRMLLKPATLIPVIDSLERKDYIKRTPDPMDRRKNYLTITETGRTTLKHIPMVDYEDTVATVVQRMGTHKQKELLLLLRELVNGLTNTTGVTDEIEKMASRE